ncbi:hypothetical protein HBH98_237300 [Parastagonospora nodorum]|uniref:Uncharacterized protein n=1 Tax=Phaeosphaeria nodorum (strain SN15 / ATCC MYA-4574 / FGSC 10173) TaxID=321614 RepID=A0A7U2F162_PHANO|nr:hypothetical protein HBH53_190500 [Parastagonospora nodorum]QRC94805.1 hypothetical protein JI435_149560 [Parastagonospora nodorum SN15]KAH3967122.1 hypothetical protein HBH52_193300 [Parastagonospora nodorum]KAH4010929.1 hypothetical protein HBI13_204740 [Parastagonospora nodorum]KAH4079555.1 hypothetical protein HBH46_233310 [Parastagonospora nodorum]
MQFTTVIVALFAAVAMAAPAAEPAPVAIAAPAAEAAPADLVARANCTECKNGKRSCCSLTTCSIYSC